MIAGIDPDTKLIVVALADSFLVAATKERLAESRFRPLISQFRALVPRMFDVTWCYIERPPMGVNPRSTIDQSMVVGAIACILHEHGIGWSLVDPGTWKKGLIGRGNADKPLIKEWAIANLGLPDNLRQDYYDASCIRRWGELNASLSAPLASEHTGNTVVVARGTRPAGGVHLPGL